MTTLRVRFDGQFLIPLAPVDFVAGQEIDMMVIPAGEIRRGSPAAVLAAMGLMRHIPPEDLELLKKTIKESNSLADAGGIFDDFAH